MDAAAARSAAREIGRSGVRTGGISPVQAEVDRVPAPAILAEKEARLGKETVPERRFEAAHRGERWAIEALLQTCRRFARHVCSNVSSSWSAEIDADELAQDAAARLLTTGLAQYDGRGSEDSYVYTLVRSTLLMRVRSADRRRRREENVADAAPLSAPADTAALEVDSLLGRLEDVCRELLRRVYLLEESYGALAADLGLVESSVRAKVSRCLRRARELA